MKVKELTKRVNLLANKEYRKIPHAVEILKLLQIKHVIKAFAPKCGIYYLKIYKNIV